MTVDYADWGGLTALQDFLNGLNLASSSLQATAAQISAAVAAAGVPLLHGVTNRLNAVPGGSGAITVAHGATQFPFIPTIAKPGYVVSISGTTASAATVPFAGVSLFWKDSVTGAQTAQENWFVPVTQGGTLGVYGKGPVKGNECSLGITNYDPAQSMTLDVQFWETTHHVSRDDWRSSTPNNVPGFTAANSDPFAGILANANTVAFAAGATSTLLLPLYSGAALLNVEQTASQTLTISVYPLDAGLGITVTPPIYQTSSSAISIGPQLLTLPRCPCILQIKNTGSSLTNVSYAMQILEYAS